MQYVLLLIVVAIIGFTIVKQLEKPELPPEPAAVSSENAPPAVPTRPQDVEQFGQDMNRFLQDAAKEQRKNVDEITRQQ
ncbi:MAG: hypothetical protein R3F53_12675 [Gammaproteobacteria bacterium]